MDTLVNTVEGYREVILEIPGGYEAQAHQYVGSDWHALAKATGNTKASACANLRTQVCQASKAIAALDGEQEPWQHGFWVGLMAGLVVLTFILTIGPLVLR